MIQSTPLYHTAKGEAYVGNSLELLAELPDNCIDLVMTSPPFALRRQKSYGLVVIRDVPATVCALCGADWIGDAIADKIERIVEEARQKHSQMEVISLKAS